MNKQYRECQACGIDVRKKAKVCPNCGSDPRPFYVKFKVPIAILIFVILVSIFGESEEVDDAEMAATSTTEVETATELEPEIQVAAADLIADYDENEVRSNEDYSGKLAEITGTIKGIDEDHDGAYVSFEGHDTFNLTLVRCYVANSDEKAKLMDLTPGQEITAIGRIQGRSVFDIEVKDCYLK